jgi:cold shock CspA family protein
MGNKLTGKVKWYNSQRGFGIITGSDGKEYFMHSSHLPPKLGEIKIGTRLFFEITPRPRQKGGDEATQVELDTSLLTKPPKPQAETVLYVDGKPYTLKRLKGKVIYYIDKDRGNVGNALDISDDDEPYYFFDWQCESLSTWIFDNPSIEFSFSVKKFINKATISIDNNLYTFKELEGKKIGWFSEDEGRTGGTLIMDEDEFAWVIDHPNYELSFSEEEATLSVTQLSKPVATDSGGDYWYQSYATETNNQSTQSKPIETKVVGVTYEGRQSIVALLSVGEEVQLVREPDNPYDKNAIKVVRKTGQCFGFISKVLASGFAQKFDDYGKPVKAVIISVTKGYSSDSNIGVTIQFNLPEMSGSESDFN